MHSSSQRLERSTDFHTPLPRSHLRPILRLQGLLTNSHTAASTTTSTSTTASSSATTLFTSTSSSTSQAFTSNATLLTQAQVQAGQAQIATIQQGTGNFVGAAWGLGSTGGAGAGSGAGAGNGTGSKFSGYTVSRYLDPRSIRVRSGQY